MISCDDERFTALIRSYGIVDVEDAFDMRSLFSPLALSKNDHFQNMGCCHDTVGIVGNGIFRFYYLDYKGRERTKHFVTDGGFLLSISSLTTGEELAFSMQALIDSEIYCAPVGPFRDALTRSKSIGEVFTEHLKKMYILKERREKSLLMKNPEERYTEFLTEHHAMCGFVPQKHIASYLGIDPVSLSRIRARNRTGGFHE